MTANSDRKKWWKRWSDLGLDTDETFMTHDGQGPDTKSRRFIVDQVIGKRPRSMADVGCGPLIDFRNLCRHKALEHGDFTTSWTGMDVSEGFLKDAIQFAGTGRHVNFRLITDPIALPAMGMEFELVYSRHVLEHQPDYLRFLSELVRISGRWIVLTFFIPPVVFPTDGPLGHHRVMIREEDGFYYNEYSSNLLHYEIESLGGRVFGVHRLEEPPGIVNEGWVIERK